MEYVGISQSWWPQVISSDSFVLTILILYATEILAVYKNEGDIHFFTSNQLVIIIPLKNIEQLETFQFTKMVVHFKVRMKSTF